LLGFSHALIHHLHIADDDREIFKIETFGFVDGGVMNITIKDFSLHSKVGSQPSKFQGGFVMRKASSESAAQQDLENIIEHQNCLTNLLNGDDFYLNVTSSSRIEGGHIIPPGGAGLYSLIFFRCVPRGSGYMVNFELNAKFHNPGPNYLSAGDAPLPLLYFVFSLLFFVALIVWLLVLCRPATNGVIVHRIHYLMAVLVLLKCLSLLFEAIRFHYISIFGSSETWSIIYYVFAFLKGVMLFTVIMLIGSGWSLMKPFLNDKEKRIIFIVLSLQVLDNVAMVVLEESAPGSQIWLTWRDVLHLVDIICCCAILFPIVWSIRHLRQAAEIDGKASRNLVKLQMFRQFYIMVVAYVYFTRIVVLLLAATIPFYLLWLGDLFTEAATLVFFVVTGIQFRPSPDNPYMSVDTDDRDNDMGGMHRNREEDMEFGLENRDFGGDDFVEVSPKTSSKSAIAMTYRDKQAP
jgi:hypothetical protein